MVNKKKLGTKRVCPSCATKFYDLDRDPVKCPKCGEEFAAETFIKHCAAVKPKKSKKSDYTNEDEDNLGMYDTDEVEVPPEGEDELAIIEDASDIGDDSNDMDEVIGSFDKGNMGE